MQLNLHSSGKQEAGHVDVDASPFYVESVTQVTDFTEYFNSVFDHLTAYKQWVSSLAREYVEPFGFSLLQVLGRGVARLQARKLAGGIGGAYPDKAGAHHEQGGEDCKGITLHGDSFRGDRISRSHHTTMRGGPQRKGEE